MDLGFRFQTPTSGEVEILRYGKTVTVLRGPAARTFLARVADAPFEESQGAMARATGNYRRGNERRAGDHPRNR